MNSRLGQIKAAVLAQANDETLWCTEKMETDGSFGPIGVCESYLQQSLRWLHQVIENGDENALAKIIAQSRDEI